MLDSTITCGNPFPYRTHLAWNSVVVNYSRRTLSRPMDKLAAISGLATAFHQLLGDDQYMAGLWKSCLLGSLLWRTEEGAVRNNVLNAPSWSWLSIDGPVSYGAWDSIIFELARSRSYRQIKSLESDLPHYDLLKTTLISLPERSDQFHRGQKCAITLRGRWFTILPLARYGDNEGGTYSTENSPAGPAFVCLDPTRPNLYAFKESLFFEIGESGELSEAATETLMKRPQRCRATWTRTSTLWSSRKLSALGR